MSLEWTTMAAMSAACGVVRMQVMGIVGWKNSGKTTLVVELVRVLTARGLRVATIKHAHHEFDIDQPGKDSYLHRAAGAADVIVSSGARWAHMHELRGAPCGMHAPWMEGFLAP